MNLNRFFDPNNWLFRELSHLVDLVGLSLLWLALCIPVVTIGPATAALYHTVVKGLRRGDPATFSRYLRSVRENLKQGTVVTLIVIPAALLLRFGFDVMYANRATAQGTMMLAVYMVVLLLPIGVLSYVFPLLGRFTFATGQLFRTALQLAAAHLPVTLLAAVLNSAAVCAMGLLVWPVLFLPTLTALVLSFPLEKVFTRYLGEEEAEQDARVDDEDL